MLYYCTFPPYDVALSAQAGLLGNCIHIPIMLLSASAGLLGLFHPWPFRDLGPVLFKPCLRSAAAGGDCMQTSFELGRTSHARAGQLAPEGALQYTFSTLAGIFRNIYL